MKNFLCGLLAIIVLLSLGAPLFLILNIGLVALVVITVLVMFYKIIGAFGAVILIPFRGRFVLK